MLGDPCTLSPRRRGHHGRDRRRASSSRLRGDYLAIVTLGFGEIIRITIESVPAPGGSQGWPMGAELRLRHLPWIWGGAVLVVWVNANLTCQPYGRALTAIREDEIAAEAAGIPTTRQRPRLRDQRHGHGARGSLYVRTTRRAGSTSTPARSASTAPSTSS
ncbi:MAG: hypothetical protein R3A52_14125 [Polyangiales bacterium]